MKEPDGSVQGVAAIVSEITGRKRDEEALRPSEQRFRDFAMCITQTALGDRCEDTGSLGSRRTTRTWSGFHPNNYGKTRRELAAPGVDRGDRGPMAGCRGSCSFPRCRVSAPRPQWRCLVEC